MGPSLAVIQKFRAVLDTTTVVTPVPVDEDDPMSSSLQNRVIELCTNNAIDVVVIAPVCSPKLSLPLDLPTAWNGKKVVVVAKPVDALAAVRQDTWMADQEWQLDGVWT